MSTGDRPPLNPKAAEAIDGQLGRRLESWKEIASWFDRSEKTVRRWEQREGMPVHRLLHEKRGTVYAYSAELEAWRQSRKLMALEEADLADEVTEDGRSGSLPPHAIENEETGSTRVDSQPAGGWRFRRRWWFMLGGAFGVLLAVVSWLAWHRNGPHGAVTEEPPIGSVAVLPLTDLAADSGEDYFADGMTEELITELGRLSSVRIISRTSIMQFKKSVRSLPEIGRQLDVDALVEGTVRRSGDRVRITVRLVRTTPEHLIWQKAYEGDLRDVLMLQRDVAGDIVGNIRAKLDPQRVPTPHPNQSLDPQAYEEYLRGRYLFAKRSSDAMTSAAGYFQKAIQRDPRYAQAYAGLAATYDMLGTVELLPPNKAFPSAIDFANKALQLDDTLSEAFTARALAECYYELNWAASDRDFQRAIALDPSSAFAHHWYGEYFSSVGNAERAISELKIARELDPLSFPLNLALARMYREAHHYEEAIQQCKQILSLAPDFPMAHWVLGQVYLAKRQYAEATSELRRANELGTTPLIVCDLGCVYAASGKKTEARAILASLESKSQFSYVSPYLIASIYSQLGEKDQAFNWLEKAFDRRDGISYLAADPMMDPLRSDPRFADLIQRLHLPQS
jgi:TolB-like protein/Tfp pilus assembly protein PilF